MTPQQLLLRKKALWVEIKSLEQEYIRIGKQIDELHAAQKDISFRVQKKLDEVQEIGEKLAEIEIEYLRQTNQ